MYSASVIRGKLAEMIPASGRTACNANEGFLISAFARFSRVGPRKVQRGARERPSGRGTESEQKRYVGPLVV